MVFSSLAFLVVFMPLVLSVFYFANPAFRPAILLLASLVFYSLGELYLLWVMLAVVLLNFACGMMIAGIGRSPSGRLESGGARSVSQRVWLIISVLGSLGILFYFKYFEFVAENVNATVASFRIDALRVEDSVRTALPLGISFYVFQSVSYSIDVYRGDVAPSRNILNFATYVTLFPQLVAGPIVRYSDIEQQIDNPQCSVQAFGEGARRFLGGLAKKVLIANPMGQVADAIFALPTSQLSTLLAWIGIIAYTLQIYFDFSGYSCMAIGLGRIFGFSFPENFRHPYIARSVREFWRRWHISLSTWFRDYLYRPLGGNRVSETRTQINLLIVFAMCGLWHGASWNFLVWGLFHGVFISLERTRFGTVLQRLPTLFSHAYLLIVVMFGWVLFRSDTLGGAFEYITRMVAYYPVDGRSVAEFMTADQILVMAAGTVLATPIVPWIRNRVESLEGVSYAAAELGWFLVTGFLYLLCLASLVAGSFNPFIYFRF